MVVHLWLKHSRDKKEVEDELDRSQEQEIKLDGNGSFKNSFLMMVFLGIRAL